MGNKIRILGVLICILFISLIKIQGQSVVIRGGGLVIENETYLVVQGDMTAKDEISAAAINLNGTILLSGDIDNQTTSPVFVNQEATPNGWVIMPNMTLNQSIKGYSPIEFENLTLSGAQKILENTNSSANGFLRLNAIFNLNKRNFILNNKNLLALEHIGGYLFAETTPIDGIGSFQWNISNNLGIFQIPFGSGIVDSADIAITYQPNTHGSIDGGIIFSTYPTSNTNTPYPNLVATLAPFNPLLTADRFWLIDADSYSQKPVASFTLRYTNPDIESAQIVKTSLKPISYNSNALLWSDYQLFENDFAANSMHILNINAPAFVKDWTITSDNAANDIFFPNAFTPDLDGNNEYFKPVMGFIPKEFAMYIYDRWGNLLYATHNPFIGWNGRYNDAECQIGAYAWKVLLVKPDGKEYQYSGHISIIK